MSEKRFMVERRYEGRNQYLGAFGLAAVFITIGILSMIFEIFKINFMSLRSWGFYMFIPAFFIIIGGISTYTKVKRLKREVLATLENYKNNRVNMDDLAKELIMERPSLMRLLIDLRTDGLIKFRVDAKTGEVIFGEAFTPPAIEKEMASKETTGTVFCPQCGYRIASDSAFCPNCGSSLQ
jgi:hypothetical protein